METERFVVAAKDDGVGESVARNTNHISIVVFVGRKLRVDIGLWNTDAQTYRLALMTGRVFQIRASRYPSSRAGLSCR